MTFPFRTGFDAVGVVDEVGGGTGTAVGDAVFGLTDPAVRGANADQAVLTAWAHLPRGAGRRRAEPRAASRRRPVSSIGSPSGPATPCSCKARGRDGGIVVQMAAARGATVIDTASERNRAFLRTLGAEPTTYGSGLADGVRCLAPDGVDALFDCAGGVLPDLIAPPAATRLAW